MRPRLPPPRVAALLFVGLLGAVLAAVLASASARVSIRTPLLPRPLRGALLRVPLERQPAAGRTVHGSHFVSAEPQELARHDALGVVLALPAGAPVRIAGAHAVIEGTSCRYESGPGTVSKDADTLWLRRGGECAGAIPATERRVALRIETADAVDLGLWAFRPRAADSALGAIRVETALGPATLRGFFLDDPPVAPRIELLQAMWGIGEGPRWLWQLFGLGVLLALGGTLVFPAGPAGPSAVRFVSRAALGGALLAGGLGVLHAIAAPPLSGPDEPYHMLGLATLVHDDELQSGTIDWIARTHVLRTRYRPGERFRTLDRSAPYVVDDPQLRATEVELRSAALARLWQTARPLLRGLDAARACLVVRLTNVALFALAVGGALVIATTCAPLPSPQWLCLPFLFVPTLPFFAMHVSETALLCSAYVILATSVAVIFLDGPRAHWAGIPLGIACGVLLAGGRAPWPLAPIAVALIVCRALLGASRERDRLVSPLVFWPGLALGVCAFYSLLNASYLDMINTWAYYVPDRLKPLARTIVSNPLPFLGLAALGGVVELALARVRPVAARMLANPARKVVRGCAWAAVAAIVLSFLCSLFLTYPELELEPRAPLSLAERIAKVLGTMATAFRLREPNFLLSTSFWVGFGWLDTIPGPSFQVLLLLLTGGGALSLAMAFARAPGEVRRFAFLAALGIGCVASLLAYTVVTQKLPMALHGRYMIGWYLIVLTLIASGPLLLEPRSERVRRARTALFTAVVGGVHAYCLVFSLQRYF